MENHAADGWTSVPVKCVNGMCKMPSNGDALGVPSFLLGKDLIMAAYVSNCDFRTSGMSMSAASKKRSAYDPARQWGLKPEESAGATYIVSGHVISGSASDSKSLYVGETIGREAQAKASRVSTKEADRALKALLEKDKDGMRTVIKAREVGSKEKDAGAKGKGKGARETPKTPTVPPPPMQKNAYSADVIKKLGFDPTGRIGIKDDTEVKKKVCLLLCSPLARFSDIISA